LPGPREWVGLRFLDGAAQVVTPSGCAVGSIATSDRACITGEPGAELEPNRADLFIDERRANCRIEESEAFGEFVGGGEWHSGSTGAALQLPSLALNTTVRQTAMSSGSPTARPAVAKAGTPCPSCSTPRG